MGKYDNVSTGLMKDDTQVLAQAAASKDSDSSSYDDLHWAINNNLDELEKRGRLK